jgi:predicted anti-sigma-YlaC factor YlaD
LNCETTKTLIQDYLDRRLVQLDRHEFLRHIDECAACERELVSYRDVYTFLGTMESVAPPRGFQNTIISQLKSEGRIYEKKVSFARRWVGGFLALPGIAKYPLAATIVIAALYLPLKSILALAGGVAVRTTVFMTEALVRVRDALGDATVLTRVWDTLTDYARVLQTILGACMSVLPSPAEAPALFAVVTVFALSSILLIVRFIRKRSAHNASLRS